MTELKSAKFHIRKKVFEYDYNARVGALMCSSIKHMITNVQQALLSMPACVCCL